MLIRVATYTNAPSTFDAGAALQQLQMAIGTGVDYLDNGWEAMVAAMIAAIRGRGGEIVTGVEAQSVVADGLSVEVHVGDRVLRASSVVVASGGPGVVERLTGARPAGRENLSPPIVSATMDLALRRPYEGIVFGLDRPLYLSPHAPVARLAPEGRGLVSVMHYVANDVGDPAAVAGVDAAGTGAGWQRDADRLEMRALARLSGIDDDDVLHEKYSHRLVVAHGSPTAAGGGLPGRPTTDALGIPGVHIAGDWVGPIGLLADAAAASGEAAAIAAVARVREHAA
jgi:phytoene dehydrogenase-like protein